MKHLGLLKACGWHATVHNQLADQLLHFRTRKTPQDLRLGSLISPSAAHIAQRNASSIFALSKASPKVLAPVGPRGIDGLPATAVSPAIEWYTSWLASCSPSMPSAGSKPSMTGKAEGSIVATMNEEECKV